MKGKEGFTAINYKGRSVKHDYIDDGINTLYFEHFRRSTYPEKGKGRHACFEMGYWCWLQAREHPIEAIRFLLHV